MTPCQRISQNSSCPVGDMVFGPALISIRPVGLRAGVLLDASRPDTLGALTWTLTGACPPAPALTKVTFTVERRMSWQNCRDGPLAQGRRHLVEDVDRRGGCCGR
jgi:hypothetical protein